MPSENVYTGPCRVRALTDIQREQLPRYFQRSVQEICRAAPIVSLGSAEADRQAPS